MDQALAVRPPKSLSTGKTYRGFNQLLLGFLGREHDTPFWGTYNQLGELGGAIKKGERSTPVSFWKQLEFPDEKAEDGTKKIMMCRYYRAFNCDQAEWQNGEPRMVREWREKHAEVGQRNPHERADQMIASFPGRPAFEQRGMVAFYSPGDDKVVVPKPELFESQTAFYQTTFHEFVHSTGHPNRLNRQKRPTGSLRRRTSRLQVWSLRQEENSRQGSTARWSRKADSSSSSTTVRFIAGVLLRSPAKA